MSSRQQCSWAPSREGPTWQKHTREHSTEPQAAEDGAPWLCRESQEALQTPGQVNSQDQLGRGEVLTIFNTRRPGHPKATVCGRRKSGGALWNHSPHNLSVLPRKRKQRGKCQKENGLGTQGPRDKWNGISSLVTRRHGLNSRPVRPLEPRELAPCSWERTKSGRSWTGNVAIQAPSSFSPFPSPTLPHPLHKPLP